VTLVVKVRKVTQVQLDPRATLVKEVPRVPLVTKVQKDPKGTMVPLALKVL
jgi:hypothetical protein